MRAVPLKMLPYDNKNELLLVIDCDEGTTLERTERPVREVEAELANGARGDRLRQLRGRVRPDRFQWSGAALLPAADAAQAQRCGSTSWARSTAQRRATRIALRLHDQLTGLADRHRARLKIVELPPGPPVLASLVAEVYGRPDHSYDDLIVGRRQRSRDRLLGRARGGRRRRHGRGPDEEAGVRDRPGEGGPERGVRGRDRAERSAWSWPAARPGRSGWPANGTRSASSCGCRGRSARVPTTWRHPGQGPVAASSPRSPSWAGGRRPRRSDDLPQEPRTGRLRDRRDRWDVRPPSACWTSTVRPATSFRVRTAGLPTRQPRPLAERTLLPQRRRRAWSVPEGIRVGFSGEGEWKITLDVFRDLGLAFGAATGDDLRDPRHADRLVPDPAGRDARDPADGPGRHAGLLAAEPRSPARPSAVTPTRSSSPRRR